MARQAFGFIYRTLLYTAAISLVLFALVISGLRYLLPQLPDVTQHVENFLRQSYAIEVNVAQISADWSSRGPELVLHDLVVQPDASKATRVDINEARVHLNFWGSASTASVQFERIQLTGMRLHYDLRDTVGASAESNLSLSDNLTSLLLKQLDHIQVTDSSLELVNLMGVTRGVTIRELRWINQGKRHQGIGKLALENVSDTALDVIIDVQGESAKALNGQVYIAANKLNITPWVQQQVIDTQIKNAEFNYHLWLNFAQNQFTDGLLQLGEQALVWQVGDTRHQLRIPQGELKLRPFKDGWRVNSNPLTIEHNERSWVLPTFSWEQTPTTTAVSLDDMPLAPLLELLNLLGSQGAAVSNELANRDAQGAIDIAFAQELKEPMRWSAHGDELSWGQFGGVPGLSNVELQLAGSGNHVAWQLEGTDTSFSSSALDYDDPWPLEKLSLSGNFQYDSAKQWSLKVLHGSELHLPGMKIGLSATITPLPDSVHIRALAQTLNDTPITAQTLREHLPVVMGDDLHDYLTVAIQDGQAQDLAMVWRGSLAHFPYHDKQGLFEARARLNQLNYKFQPNWRPIFDANAVLNFTNERMHIVAEEGELAGVKLNRVDVVLPDMLAGDSAQLVIQADVAGDAKALKPVFDESPLADSLGATFAELQLEGAMNSQFELTIPLTDQPDVVADGYADLIDNKLRVNSLGETLTGLTGRVNFRNDVIDASELALQWRGLPLTVSMTSQTREQDYFVNVEALGNWNFADYAPLLNGELLDGDMPWQANFNLSLPEQGGYSFRWQQTAQLDDLAINAPPPLQKDKGIAQQLELIVSGSQDSILVNAEMGGHALIELQLDGSADTLQSGYARIGAAFSQSPNPNLVRLTPKFTVDLNLAEADLDDWLRTYKTIQRVLPESAPTSELAAIIQPDFIQLVSDRIHYGDQALTQVGFVAWPAADGDGWDARLESEQILTDISWQPKQAERKAALRLAAEFIDIDVPVEDTSTPMSVADEPDKLPQTFAGLPDIYLQCKRCRYGLYDLGKVVLQLSEAGNTLNLVEFSAEHRNYSVTAEGSWALETATQHPQTRIAGRFSSPDFGDFLENHEFTSMVRDSDAEITFDLSYLGAPHQAQAASLNGVVDWQLGQGYLNEVSDRGARLFSLLSLDGILRKLRFDFRDVFANGLFYTNFGGEFTIVNGIVTTNNTQLSGAAGDMEVQGQTNLMTRALDYDLQFVPKVTSSLPVILAWMINPPSGLAALVIDRLLHDAKVISRLEYKISGTMDDPKIEEVARDSRDAPIPPEVQNDAEKPESEPKQEPKQEPSATQRTADDQQSATERKPTDN